MKLIVGLGNPGKEYDKTRHNAGFLFLDEFVKGKNIKDDWKEKDNYLYIKSGDLILCKPQTFMNLSGQAVRKVAAFYKVSIDDIIIAHDDLDIKLGEFKIQKGKGPRVHNGINSVESSLGSVDFWRIRIGIENRGDKPVKGVDYVLERFLPSELKLLKNTFEEIGQNLNK